LTLQLFLSKIIVRNKKQNNNGNGSDEPGTVNGRLFMGDA